MSENKRCYRCKCLEVESTYKWNIRTRYDLDAKFFCRKCVKKQDIPLEPKKEKVIKFDFKKVRDISYDELCMYLLEKREKNLPFDERESHLLGNMRRTMSNDYIKKLLDTLRSNPRGTPFNRFTQNEIDAVIHERNIQKATQRNLSYQT